MNKGQAKTGRKGDPRMHRAVAARMENPELSLFEALRIGGFDYPADEDASIMDAEKVTLGQRKNQLSRRLRLARKQQEEAGDNGNSMMDNSMGVAGMQGMGNLDAKMKLQQLQQQNAAAAAAANGAMSSEAQRQLEKLMQHSQQAKLSSGVKRNAQLAELGPDAEIHPNDEDAGLMDEKNARRMAKFHPQYQPLFIPRAASVRNSFSGGTGSQLSSQLSSQLTSSTPQLGPLTAPLTPLGGPASTTSFAAAAAANPGLFPSAGGLLGQTSSLTQRRTTAAPSGVAIASLSATAQSVGLSLEQLAVALSSSSNLVKVLSNNSGSEQQQELALRLFRNESRALYQRCMLLAGFRPEDAEEKSQSHLQFAFSAWQMEGKRLQELMGDDSGNVNAAAGAPGPSSNLKLSGNAMTGMMNMKMEGSDDRQQQLQQQLQQQQQQQQQMQQQHQQQQQQMQQRQEEDHHSHGHSHGHGHGHSHGDNGNTNGNGGGGGGHDHAHEHGHSHEHQFNGHHVHQLEGKCGHKAIIHQPKDGSAHIDFVVGDKVECYSGIQPMGNKSLSVWPSKYKCEDLSCPQPCDNQQCDDETQPVDLDMNGNRAPKILDLSDIDLSGAEWNSDLSGSMGGTLLGLFKLGDSDKESEGPSQGNGSNNDGFGISV